VTLRWQDVPLSRDHDRKSFDCGEPALNDYLARYARQNHESGGAKTFVAIDARTPAAVLGYYTLSPASIDYARTPDVARRGLGRYEVPVYRLGRIAIASSVQGRGLGSGLLLAAGRRCLAVAAEVGGVALLIDAKGEMAAKWYESFGAVRLADAPLTLVLTLKTIAQAIETVR
jgi:GNAT superfamily N-acetyltransferase